MRMDRGPDPASATLSGAFRPKPPAMDPQLNVRTRASMEHGRVDGEFGARASSMDAL